MTWPRSPRLVRSLVLDTVCPTPTQCLLFRARGLPSARETVEVRGVGRAGLSVRGTRSQLVSAGLRLPSQAPGAEVLVTSRR